MTKNEPHEKRAIIEPGRTPPEDESQKAASVSQLEGHVRVRLSELVKGVFQCCKDNAPTSGNK